MTCPLKLVTYRKKHGAVQAIQRVGGKLGPLTVVRCQSCKGFHVIRRER